MPFFSLSLEQWMRLYSTQRRLNGKVFVFLDMCIYYNLAKFCTIMSQFCCFFDTEFLKRRLEIVLLKPSSPVLPSVWCVITVICSMLSCLPTEWSILLTNHETLFVRRYTRIQKNNIFFFECNRLPYGKRHMGQKYRMKVQLLPVFNGDRWLPGKIGFLKWCCCSQPRISITKIPNSLTLRIFKIYF